MTITAFWLILFSVILHVSWNLISKASRPSAAFYVLSALVATLVTTPFLFYAHIDWTGFPPIFWLYFALTSVANITYYCGLFMTYKHSDISMSYPLIRALPVLLTAVVTSIFGIGKLPSYMALGGMFIVFCGCLLMPLTKWSDFRPRNYFSPVLGTIFLAALGTTSYTILDKLAFDMMLQHSPASSFIVSSAYMCLMEGIIALGLSVFLIQPQERKIFMSLLKAPFAPCISGVFTVSAYILVLLAMSNVTNVSYVQAFRQMGLPMGVAAGVLLLKEKCSAARLVGITTILLGLIIVAFG